MALPEQTTWILYIVHTVTSRESKRDRETSDAHMCSNKFIQIRTVLTLGKANSIHAKTQLLGVDRHQTSTGCIELE